MPGGLVDAEIDQVAELRTDQELGGHVADGTTATFAVGAGGLHPALQQTVTHCLRERMEAVAARRRSGETGLHIHQLVEQATLQRVHAEPGTPVSRPTEQRSRRR